MQTPPVSVAIFVSGHIYFLSTTHVVFSMHRQHRFRQIMWQKLTHTRLLRLLTADYVGQEQCIRLFEALTSGLQNKSTS